jgi:hypothetical protein
MSLIDLMTIGTLNQQVFCFSSIRGGMLRRIAAGVIDPDDLRGKIGQHHRAEQCRTKAGEFDDADSLQQTHGLSIPAGRGRRPSKENPEEHRAELLW